MSESMEDIKRSRNHQRERVKHLKIARNRHIAGLVYWRERALLAETTINRLLVDTEIKQAMHKDDPTP